MYRRPIAANRPPPGSPEAENQVRTLIDELRAFGQMRLAALQAEQSDYAMLFWQALHEGNSALLAGAAACCRVGYVNTEVDGNLPLLVAVQACQHTDAVGMVGTLRTLGARIDGVHAQNRRNVSALDVAVDLVFHEEARARMLPVIRALLDSEPLSEPHFRVIERVCTTGWRHKSLPPTDAAINAACLKAVADMLATWPGLRSRVARYAVELHLHDILALPVWEGYRLNEEMPGLEGQLRMAHDAVTLAWGLKRGVDGKRLLCEAIDVVDVEAARNLAAHVDPNDEAHGGSHSILEYAEEAVEDWRGREPTTENYFAKAVAIHEILMERAAVLA